MDLEELGVKAVNVQEYETSYEDKVIFGHLEYFNLDL